MASSKFKSNTLRKWDKSKEEKFFEEMLLENGFTVLGIKEYQTKTIYLIEKNSISQEYNFEHLGGGKTKASGDFKCFCSMFDIRVQYEAVKAQFTK